MKEFPKCTVLYVHKTVNLNSLDMKGSSKYCIHAAEI
jgi:hypothetical protein